jgi:PAS domain S-box-containing protein
MVPQKGHLIFRMKTIPTVFEDGKKGTTILLEDITARKRADAALRASEEQFRLMADTVRDGIIIHEGNKTTYMNARAEEILGYSKEELASLTPIDLAAPEERERIRALLADAQEGIEPPSDIMLWIQRKDGTRRFIANRIASIRQGQKTTCYIISTDLTDWKRTHDALEDQFRFLQHMINTFPNPLYYLDPDGRFIGCNSSFCTLVAKRYDEIVGKVCETLLEDGRATVFGEHGDELDEGKGVVTYTGLFISADNRRCYLRIQKSGLILADGRCGGLVGLVLSADSAETLT